MWNKTRVAKILEISYPIIQGPFGGGYSTVDLVATVSNAGGVGSFGAMESTPDQIREISKSIRSATDKPYAINLWVSNRDAELASYGESEYDKLKKIFKPYFDEFNLPLPALPEVSNPLFENQVEALLDAAPPIFSFIFGIPSNEILQECRKRGIKIMGTATTPDEAIALEQAGVDVVIASGFEAGGHRASFLGSVEESLTGIFSLIPVVADSVAVPVVAAGGIADGRGVAAAMILGAEGVQVGTAFLACAESNASPLHKKKLFSEEAKYTMLTKVFSGRSARGIRNKLSQQLKSREHDIAPFPLQRLFLKSLSASILEKGREEYMGFWAGQSAPLLKYSTALELFHALVNDAGRILDNK